MRVGTLFSGIGGFEYAAKLMDWQIAFTCENNPFCQTVLKYYYSEAEHYGDIKETDFTKWAGAVDIVVGGFPCQPYSLAGNRLGKEDPRHLWPEMLRAVKQIKPRWIVGENVYGLLNWNGGLVFDEIQSDLENEGYKVLAVILPAVSVNAPHLRNRIWFVAYSESGGRRGLRNAQKKARTFKSYIAPAGKYRVQDAKQFATNTGLLRSTKRQIKTMGIKQLCTKLSFTNTESNRRFRNWQKIKIKKRLQTRSKFAGQLSGRFKGLRLSKTITNPNGYGQQWWRHRKSASSQATIKRQKDKRQWFRANLKRTGKLAIATNTSNSKLQRSILNRSTGETRPIKTQSGQFSGSVCTNWQNFPTQSPICGRNDGLPTKLHGITFSKWRNESLKAYGNAVVPQIVLNIYKSIEKYESL